jgi:hypothetical protein
VHNFQNMCLNIVFDDDYTEPALLTAFELISFLPEKVAVQLTYAYTANPNNDVMIVLAEFARMFTSGGQLELRGIDSGPIRPFSKLHFSKTVLLKALAPHYCDHKFIFTVDAGTLCGNRFAEVTRNWSIAIEESCLSGAPVFAYCEPADRHLSPPHKALLHNSHYPFGWILGFNRENYKAKNIGGTLTGLYNRLHSSLLYPEQELLCIALEKEQLVPILGKELLLSESIPFSIDFSEEGRIGDWRKNLGLYKVEGSVKPWSQWVLSPKRYRYLEARNKLEMNFPLASFEIIKNNRSKCNNQVFAQRYIELYESHITSLPS